MNDIYICMNANFNSKLHKHQKLFLNNNDQIVDQNNNFICMRYSQNALTNLAYDTDGRGRDRYKLIQNIKLRISHLQYFDKCKKMQAFFDDPKISKYNKQTDNYNWVWDRRKISTAPIDDLNYIWNIVKQW